MMILYGVAMPYMVKFGYWKFFPIGVYVKYIPNSKGLGPLILDEKIFKVCPYITLCKTTDLPAGSFLTLGL